MEYNLVEGELTFTEVGPAFEARVDNNPIHDQRAKHNRSNLTFLDLQSIAVRFLESYNCSWDF